MKKLTIFCFALVAGLFLTTINPATVQAQADEDEIKLYQTMYGMEKRNLINEAMSLTAENKDAFWGVYEAFEIERRATGKERIELIKSYIEGENYFISIRDNGVGMNDSTMQRIFDPFYTTREVGEGMGMGLSISHTIVENHGSQLQVESAKGEWAKFTFHLKMSNSS